jgi:hypothetical protein
MWIMKWEGQLMEEGWYGRRRMGRRLKAPEW